VIGAHNEDYALAIANSGTCEQTDRLPDKILIRIRIDDVAAWMWMSQNRGAVSIHWYTPSLSDSIVAGWFH
jgi:hypothetical protein